MTILGSRDDLLFKVSCELELGGFIRMGNVVWWNGPKTSLEDALVDFVDLGQSSGC